MSYKIIYKPKGMAGEYAPDYAVNLYNGCSHGCTYCYCPGILRMSREEFAKPEPKKNALEKLESDLQKFPKDKELFFSFMTDPFHSPEATEMTYRALLLCEKYGLEKVNLLTKGGARVYSLAIELIRQNQWRFGQTIIFMDDEYWHKYEPKAGDVFFRIDNLVTAKSIGVDTWLSLEPVIYPEQALKVLRWIKPHVNEIKIGKINHNKVLERAVDWRKFCIDAEAVLADYEGKVYWKDSLKPYRGEK